MCYAVRSSEIYNTNSVRDRESTTKPRIARIMGNRVLSTRQNFVSLEIGTVTV